MAGQLVQGAIIRAEVLDPAGKNPKIRPLIVTSPSASISQLAEITTVAISSTFAEPIQPDEVRLPWHPRGNVQTRLIKPCVAKCGWQPIVPKSAILEIKGYVPRPQLQRILDIVAQL